MADSTKSQPKTAVYMTEEEQQQFLLFTKYQKILEELERVHFYEMKGGSIELHKDRYGNLSTIVQHSHFIVVKPLDSY